MSMKWSLVPMGSIGFEGRDMAPGERGRSLEDMYFEGERRAPYLWRFAALTVFSSAVAALGLIADSTAVVIGAMLIAPLMSPIMALSGAIVQAWPRRQIENLVIVMAGALVAVAVGWVVAALTPRIGPDAVLAGEIIARTEPALVDLGIAIVAGAAGAYVTVRSEASSALPGVGIAVALVPPLAAVGITLNAGEPDLAVGAALLFLTNLAAIVLAGGLMLLFAGFGSRAVNSRERRIAVGTTIALVLAVVVPLAINSAIVIKRSEHSLIAARVVDDWVPGMEITDLEIDERASPIVFDLEVSGIALDADADTLAATLAAEIGEPVVVEISFIPEIVGRADP